MRQVPWLTILRWVCVLPVIVAGFIATAYLALPFDNWCYEEAVRLGYQTPIDQRIPPYLPISWYGAVAAVVVVLSGTSVAPSHRRVIALVLYGAGALTAYALESDAIIGPLVGGALAVAGVFLVTRKLPLIEAR